MAEQDCQADRKALAWKLSGFYAAYFLAMGLYLPYWPLWLNGKGLSAVEIGWVLAAGFWVKVIAQPAVARLADLYGRTRLVTTVLMTLAALGFLALVALEGFWLLFLAAGLTAACYQPVLPVMESVVLRHAGLRRLEYGRIRLWGSVAFIIATAGGGWWIDVTSPQSVAWLVAVAMGLVALACRLAPDRPIETGQALRTGSWGQLIRPAFLWFLLTGGLINASHAMLYGFATLHWRSLGHSETLIGIYWTFGVATEIGLFMLAGRFAKGLDPAIWLGLAALAGAVRWPLLAVAEHPVALLALQSLHGLTFGAGHLGAMLFLAHATPSHLAATGQSLYSALVGGVLAGGMFPLTGLIFQEIGAMTYLLMGALSAGAVLSALVLSRISRQHPV